MASRIRRLNRLNTVPDSESDDDPVSVGDNTRISAELVELSDDDPDSAANSPVPPTATFARLPVEELLWSRGVRPRTQWLDSCLNELATVHLGFADMSVARKAELCFGQFLMADFNLAGAASLPPSMHTQHGTELRGPFVLQVDEVTDIGHSLRDRYVEKPAGPTRTLKLSMTDGAQRVTGLEYRPIKALQVLSPAGMKISLKNVCVRRGVLMLVPEVVEVLGGVVEHLELARQRAVQVINKPPRGRRTRQGTVEPSLAENATRAAWPASLSERVAQPLTNNRHPEQHRSDAEVHDAPGSVPSNRHPNPASQHMARPVQQSDENDGMQHRHPESSGQSGQVSHLQQPARMVSMLQAEERFASHQPPELRGQSAQGPHLQQSSRIASQQQQELRETQHQSAVMSPLDQLEPLHLGSITNTSKMPQLSNPLPAGSETVDPESNRQPIQNDRTLQLSLKSIRVSGMQSTRFEVENQPTNHQGHVAESSRASVSCTVEESTPQSQIGKSVVPTQSCQSSRLVQSKLRLTPAIQLTKSVEQPHIFPIFQQPHILSTTQQPRVIPTIQQPHVIPTIQQPQPQKSPLGGSFTTPMELDDSDESDGQIDHHSSPRSRNSSLDIDVVMEVPFTYLVLLSERLKTETVVRGHVKCVITGVASFQFKDCDEFKLHVHIEDGSFITAAFVQHQLVQRLVGCSPREVMIGLQNPDTKPKMIENMHRFQKFLETFEGFMDVEFLDPLSGPTILQMTTGFPCDSANLLLDRFQHLIK